MKETKGESKFNLWYLAAGASIILGIVGLWLYSQTMAIGFALLVLGGLGGGGVIIYWQYTKTAYHGTSTVTVAGRKQAAFKLTDENSLNLYPVKDESGKVHNDRIAFEKKSKEELAGRPWRYRANNQFYYLNQLDLAKQATVPYYLKDGVYVDPADLAGALECRPVRKYLKHRESLMKYVGPAILVIAFVIECIMIIAIGG